MNLDKQTPLVQGPTESSATTGAGVGGKMAGTCENSGLLTLEGADSTAYGSDGETERHVSL